MTPSTKVGIAGVVLGLILLACLPWWAAFGIIIIAARHPGWRLHGPRQVAAPPAPGDPRTPAGLANSFGAITPAGRPARCRPAGYRLPAPAAAVIPTKDLVDPKRIVPLDP